MEAKLNELSRITRMVFGRSFLLVSTKVGRDFSPHKALFGLACFNGFVAWLIFGASFVLIYNIFRSWLTSD